jgi:hypothetical protein
MKSACREPNETFPGRSRKVLAATGDHSENLGERKTDDNYPKGYSDELLGKSVQLPSKSLFSNTACSPSAQTLKMT